MGKLIKKSVLVFILILLLSAAAFAAGNGTVTGSKVNMRSAPSTGASVVCVLSKGDSVSVAGQSGDWYSVSAGGNSGYIFKDYLQVTSTASYGTVTGDSVNFREEPSVDSKILDNLPRDTSILILSVDGDWAHIQYAGTKGYMSAQYVAAGAAPQEASQPAPKTGKITGSGVRFRAEASTDSSIITFFSQGTIVNIIAPLEGWYKVEYNGNTGYVSSSYISLIDGTSRSSDNDSTLNDIVEYAKGFLGVKYVYGGASPNGFDCSGFTYYVLSHFGISVPRSGHEQYNALTKINRADLKLGDLVFFSSPGSKSIQHVGIYISSGNFIHASSPGDVVKITSMSSGYYNTYYYGSARYLR